MDESALCSRQQQVSPVSLKTEVATKAIARSKAMPVLHKPSGPFSVTCHLRWPLFCLYNRDCFCLFCAFYKWTQTACVLFHCVSLGSRFVSVVHVGAIASRAFSFLTTVHRVSMTVSCSTLCGFLGGCGLLGHGGPAVSVAACLWRACAFSATCLGFALQSCVFCLWTSPQ